jgi:hypothetical protein
MIEESIEEFGGSVSNDQIVAVLNLLIRKTREG